MSSSVKLGRGLDALLGTSTMMTELSHEQETKDAVRMVSIEKLQQGAFQPRMDMSQESINELAESIRAHGIIQPILARTLDDGGGYEIIAGERRWRAAQLASLHEVPVIVKKVEDRDAMAMALIENIQRENLNAVEEASMLKRLVEDFELSHAQVAQSVGKSRATITNLLRLLTLTASVLKMLRASEIETGHAKALLGLKGQAQIDAARIVSQKSLSVRKTESLVKNWNRKKPVRKPTDPSAQADIARLESAISDRVDATVSIRDANGKGFIRIEYKSLDQLDVILDKLDVVRE